VTVEPQIGVSVRVRAAAATHRGHVRVRNEDSIAVGGWAPVADVIEPLELVTSNGQPMLAVVADGAGGHPGGDVASRIVTRHLAELSPRIGSAQALENAIVAAHEQLHAHARTDRSVAGMGSTVAAVVITADSVLVGNVGDSRVYELLGDDDAIQLSTDDSPMRPDFVTGEFTTSALTQMLGGTEHSTVSPHVARYAVEDGLSFLLCSDGLTACVDEQAIAEVLAATSDGTAIARALLQRALINGAPDNVSIIHLRTEAPHTGAANEH
jgi:serine/threonine protein phosphatase PrpC